MNSRTLHLCSIDHDEVCFSGDECPVCKEKDRSREELGKVCDLAERVKSLEMANKRANETVRNSREIEIVRRDQQRRRVRGKN